MIYLTENMINLRLYRDSDDAICCRIVCNNFAFSAKADEVFGDLLHYALHGKQDLISSDSAMLYKYFYPKKRASWVSFAIYEHALTELRDLLNRKLDLFAFDVYFSQTPSHELLLSESHDCNDFSKPLQRSELLKHGMDKHIMYQYHCSSLTDVFNGFLHYFAMQSSDLIKCERCGKWFIPDNTVAQKYCRRMYGDMNCSQLASKTLRAERGDTPITAAYHRVDNMLRKRKNSDPEHMQEADQKIWDQFRAEYKTNKKTMSNDELLSWLEGQAAKLRRKGADIDT